VTCHHEHGDDQYVRGESAGGIRSVEHLVEHLRPYVSEATAIVCIGNELCGDDGAGPLVARGLAGAVPWDVYDTGTVPESFLMKITARRPQTVIVVDALHFGAEVGAVELIEPEGLTGQGPSTHGPAPLSFLEVLEMIYPCRPVVLGIEPQRVDFGEPISRPVAQAVDLVVRAFEFLGREATCR